MVLKEAFRYQNYLGTLINNASSYLSSTDNVTTKKQEHLRSKVNNEAEDETIEVPKRSDLEYTPNQVIDFLIDVLSEKEKLSDAIDKAKNTSIINIDSSIAINKQKQNVATILSRIADLKSNEKITRGSGYKFNQEGNQIAYYYDVKEVTAIDFDRNKVKGIIKKLRGESDSTSNTLDKLQVEIDVQYSPVYDLNDSFEDALYIFASK
jgi:hypothetical protein